MQCVYLNDGTGAPCAGHERDIISFSLLTNRLSLVSLVNFGAAPPMGAIDNTKFANSIFLLQYSLLPKCWYR